MPRTPSTRGPAAAPVRVLPTTRARLPLTLRLLGGFSVSRGGETVSHAHGGRDGARLVRYLLAHRDTRGHRGRDPRGALADAPARPGPLQAADGHVTRRGNSSIRHPDPDPRCPPAMAATASASAGTTAWMPTTSRRWRRWHCATTAPSAGCSSITLLRAGRASRSPRSSGSAVGDGLARTPHELSRGAAEGAGRAAEVPQRGRAVARLRAAADRHARWRVPSRIAPG